MDYRAEALRQLREHHDTELLDRGFSLGSHLNARDVKAVRESVSGLVKLLYPQGDVLTADLAELGEMAIEGRRWLKEQLTKMGSFEYHRTLFSYLDRETLEERFVGVPCEAGVALVIAIYAGLKKHSVLPGLVILGDLSIQRNFKAVRVLTEPLQIGMDNGARRPHLLLSPHDGGDERLGPDVTYSGRTRHEVAEHVPDWSDYAPDRALRRPSSSCRHQLYKMLISVPMQKWRMPISRKYFASSALLISARYTGRRNAVLERTT